MSNGYIKVFSVNCPGLRDKSKRAGVLDYFEHFKNNIICLQNTYLTILYDNNLRSISGCECLISGTKINLRDVSIIWKNDFEYKLIKSAGDNKSNLINVFIWGFTSFSTLYRSYHDG